MQGHIGKCTAKIGVMKGILERQDPRPRLGLERCVQLWVWMATPKQVHREEGCKDIVVFGGQDCLPFRLNGDQMQEVSGFPKEAWSFSSPESCHQMKVASFL